MNVEQIIKTKKKIPLRSRSIIHLILVNSMISETMSASLKPFGVSQQQFNVLRILRGQLGKPANLSTLNDRMVTKMSNTTRLVDKLLTKGFVQRCICPSNRRKIEITITAKGLDTLKEMDKAVKSAETKILKNLSKTELEQLNLLLDKF